MNGKKIGYVLLTISLVMIISGGVSSFLIGLNEDRELTFRRMDDVSSKFEDFSTMTTLFEDKREILYSSVIGNTYYDFGKGTNTESDVYLLDGLGDKYSIELTQKELGNYFDLFLRNPR